MPVLFCGDRTGAEYVTYSLLSKFGREIGERYKLLVKAGKQAGITLTTEESGLRASVVSSKGGAAR